LLLSHDWDFILRAIRHVEPQFVPDELLTYRFHARNSSHGLYDRIAQEGTLIFERYLQQNANAPVNELAPTRHNWPVFFDFFCSQVTPWFSREPLARHVERLGFQAPTSSLQDEQHMPARDCEAIQRLRDGLARDCRVTRADLARLRAEIARNWQMQRSHETS
jgi:hypothetical protein